MLDERDNHQINIKYIGNYFSMYIIKFISFFNIKLLNIIIKIYN